MTTKSLPSKTVETLPQAILDAIAAGHLDHTIAEVNISAKASPTKKDESRSFDSLMALDAEGMALLCSGKIETQTPKPAEGKDERTEFQKKLGACDHFNYGYDLRVRAQVRDALVTSIEGPEKTIEKLVKANVAMFDTEAETREFVIARLKSKGTIPADYGVASTTATETATATA